MNVSLDAVRPVQESGNSNSLRAQISRVTKQIVKLSAKLQEISRSNISQKEKETEMKLVQSQIDALSAQLARLIAELARGDSRAADQSRSSPENAGGTAAGEQGDSTETYLPSGVTPVSPEDMLGGQVNEMV